MSNKSIKSRLLDIVDQCKTQREAALLLGASEQYIYILTRELGITKWRQKNRDHKDIKTEKKICEECGEIFYRKILNNSPGRFCSNKCKGKNLGDNYGFGKTKKR